jgi:hypothetical protein
MIWNFHPSSLSSMTGFREWLTPILGKKVNFRNEFEMGKGGGGGGQLWKILERKRRGAALEKLGQKKNSFHPK